MAKRAPIALVVLVALAIWLFAWLNQPDYRDELTVEDRVPVEDAERPRRRPTDVSRSIENEFDAEVDRVSGMGKPTTDRFENTRLLVSGIVLSKDSKEPIAGAVVYVYRTINASSKGANRSISGDRASGPVARNTSTKNGRFELNVLRGKTSPKFEISVYHPRYLRPKFQTIDLAPVARASDQMRLTFELDGGLKIAGRVVDEAGVGVPGLMLIASTGSVGAGTMTFKSSSTMPTKSARLSPPWNELSIRRVTTDELGNFVLAGTRPRDQFRIVAERFDYRLTPDDRFSTRDKNLVLVANQSDVIVGRVYDQKTGDKIRGFNLWSLCKLGEGKMPLMTNCRDGEFRLSWPWPKKDIKSGVLRILADGYYVKLFTIKRSGQSKVHELEVPMVPYVYRDVELRCFQTSGRPFLGPIEVFLYGDDGHSYFIARPEVEGASGLRRIKLPMGKWKLGISPDHFARRNFQPEISLRSLETDVAAANGLVWTLREGCTLTIETEKYLDQCLLVAEKDGKTAWHKISSREHTFLNFPLGEWSFEIKKGHQVLAEKSVVLRLDEKRVIKFP